MIGIIHKLGFTPEDFVKQTADFLWAKYTGMAVVFAAVIFICFMLIWCTDKDKDFEQTKAIRNVALLFIMIGIIGLIVVVPKIAELYMSPDVTALMWIMKELE